MLITREASILCEHGVGRTTCSKCSPPSVIATTGTPRDRTIPIVTGVLTIGRGCRWLGKAVLHCKDECECDNIPDDYVQVTRAGAPFTAYLVGIIRDTKLVPHWPFKRKKQRVERVDFKVLYRFQCRMCWPDPRRFDTEDGAIDHLSRYHHVTISTRITEVMADVARSATRNE